MTTEKFPMYHRPPIHSPSSFVQQPQVEPDDSCPQIHESLAFLTTEPDNLTASTPERPAKKAFSRAKQLWRKAYFKIKVQRAVERVNAELLDYGTNELMDGDKMYKENLDDLLDRKVQKRERFREAKDNKSALYSRKRFLFYPDSKFKQMWAGIMSVVMLYVASVTPYRLAFYEDVFYDGWTIMEFTLDGLFCTDIIINFFSCYQVEDGSIVDDRLKIACGYLRTWFLIDLVSSLPFSVIDIFVNPNQSSSGPYNSALKLARLPRLYKLFRLARIIKALRHYQNSAFFEKMQDFFQINSRLVKLAKFLLMVSVCIHLMGCIWFFEAKLSEFSPDTWVVRFNFMDVGPWYQYLAAIYWTVTTCVTVGYGDITPRTELEMALAVGWMIIGVGFYSYTVGSLSSFLTSIDTRDSILAAKMAAMQEFAKETGISPDVKIRVRDAIRYSTWKRGSVWSDKHSLFNEIPRGLQFEVAQSMYSGVIKELHFFSNRGRSFILYFMPILRPLRFHSGEYLYKEGEYADEMYFIAKGRVNLVLWPQEIAYKSYLRGSYVGEIEIVRALRRIDNALVFGETELLAVAKNDFLCALDEFPVEGKDILKVVSERYKRHRQAMLETVELLHLKKQRGTLNDIAGKDRLITVQEQDAIDLSPEEYMRK